MRVIRIESIKLSRNGLNSLANHVDCEETFSEANHHLYSNDIS